MSTARNIAKNASWLLMATTLQKILAFVSFTLAARWIGKEQTGVFFYAISITSIAVVFADLGLTPVVIRAVAGGKENAPRLFGAALRAKAVLIPLSILVAIGTALFFDADRVTLITVLIACLVMSADTLNLVYYGTLRGRQNLRPEAIGMFLGQVASSSLAVIAAWRGWGPIGLACALLVASSWNVVWAWWNARRQEVRVTRPTRADIALLVRQAIPFAIAGLAVKVYSYIDSVILNATHGSGAVGLYAVAYKLTYALQFLPLTFTAALYPALASTHAQGSHEESRKVFLGSLRLMAAVGFPLTAGLSALAPRIIPRLYGDHFLGSVAALSVLPWVLLPIFMDFPIGALLNASHRAHQKTMAMVSTMFVNVALNAVLIPRLGVVGAAWAGVGSFWMLYLIGIALTAQDAGRIWTTLWLTIRAVSAAAISWVSWRLVGDQMSFMTAILFGGAVAILLAFLTKLVTVDDVYRVLAMTKPASTNVESVHE